MRKTVTALALLAVAGCATVPELKKPALDLPAAWPPASGQSAAQVAPDWWKAFGDPRLDALVQEALEHNADIPVGRITIRQYASATPPPGYTDRDTYTEITDAEIHVRTESTPAYTSFLPTKLVIANPNARRQAPGRVTRAFTYNMLATTGAYPLVIART